MIAELLASVVLSIAGQPVSVTCGQPPPALQTWSRALGAAVPPPLAHIWLRDCRAAYELEPLGVTVFAHEILHVIRPWWSHARIYRVDDWYGRAVVGPKIARRRE